MQANLFSIIEIQSIFTKLLILNLDSNKIYVIAADRILTKGFHNGEIVNEEEFLAFIDKLVDHVENKYKIESQQMILVLPTIDHVVHTVGSKMSILSAMNIITQADIDAIRKDCRYVKLPDSLVVVEEVPIEYQLDSGKVQPNPPLQIQSTTLALKSAVHVLEKKYVEPLMIAFDDKNIEILTAYLSSFACYSASESLVNKLNRTVLVHFDDDAITYSVFEKGFLTKTNYVRGGESVFLNHLSNKFNLSIEDASKTFESLFLIDSNRLRDICIDANDLLSELSVHNEIMPLLDNMLSVVATNLNNYINETNLKTDVIFTGKWLNYRGLVGYFNQKYPLNVKGAYLNEFGVLSNEFITSYGAFIRYLEQNKTILLDFEDTKTNTLNQNNNIQPNQNKRSSLNNFDDDD